MISIKNVKKVFGEGDNQLHALDDVSITIERGEIFGVVGPSGAGKSTLIRCVNMLEKPTSGSIKVNNIEVTTLSSQELRKARQRMGMIFQHFNLLSSRTVTDNVAFPLEITGVEKSIREERVKELLKLVDLSEKADAYPAQLSGGQKQRVGIARALATQPDILLSDEATSALDPQTTTSILNLLKELNRNLGLTILLITHEMEVVRQICDRVAVLKNGKVVESGTLNDLMTQPDSYIARSLFPPEETILIHPGAIGVTIYFIGDAADQPILANLVRKFELDVNILGGSIQSVGNNRIGRLQVEMRGQQANQALEYLRSLGLRLEVF
ncbi:MAG: ATP-binding cassette domain-containing protein [Anaerolineaceae bacterium]